jgi:hypothetical protein
MNDDNTDNYFLLINKKLQDHLCFTDKQELDVLFQISQSKYFGIHFQWLLV